MGLWVLIWYLGGYSMELDVKAVLQVYQEELTKLQNENLLLKVEILQLKEKLNNSNYKEGDE